MGAYKNFVQDFPQRCLSILEDFEEASRVTGKEVTLMLATATSGFMVPFARLAETEHPSRNRDEFRTARQEFDGLMNRKFLGSKLCPGNDAATWVHCREIGIVGCNPSGWMELNEENSVFSNQYVNCLLYHLRNALAHGNIFSLGDPIDRLIFLSSYKDKEGNLTDKFSGTTVAPQDFRAFLLKWFEFIKELELPLQVSKGELMMRTHAER